VFWIIVARFPSSCNTPDFDNTDTPDVFPQRIRNGRRTFE
jgi:hypothetical protein